MYASMRTRANDGHAGKIFQKRNIKKKKKVIILIIRKLLFTLCIHCVFREDFSLYNAVKRFCFFFLFFISKYYVYLYRHGLCNTILTIKYISTMHFIPSPTPTASPSAGRRHLDPLAVYTRTYTHTYTHTHVSGKIIDVRSEMNRPKNERRGNPTVIHTKTVWPMYRKHVHTFNTVRFDPLPAPCRCYLA